MASTTAATGEAMKGDSSSPISRALLLFYAGLPEMSSRVYGDFNRPNFMFGVERIEVGMQPLSGWMGANL